MVIGESEAVFGGDLVPFDCRPPALRGRKNLQGGPVSMIRITLVAVLAAFTFATIAQAGNPDPRKCIYGATRKADCANDAAVRALRIKEARITGHPYSGHGDINWTAAIHCTGSAPKYLLWTCTWTSNPTDTPGKARVKFWATSSGWHTLVTVVSQAVKA